MADTALDRLYDSLSVGDIDAAAQSLTDDGVVWHCFDRIEHDKPGAVADWNDLIANFPERTFANVRQLVTPSGLVREHTATFRMADGRIMAWDCCVIVTFRDGLIQRLNEYIDRGGVYQPPA